MKRTEFIKVKVGVKVLSTEEKKAIKGRENSFGYPIGSICHKYGREQCNGECIDIDGYISKCIWSERKEECACPISM